MLTNATHYEQVSLETVKKILARKVIFQEEIEREAGGPTGGTKRESLKRDESEEGKPR